MRLSSPSSRDTPSSPLLPPKTLTSASRSAPTLSTLVGPSSSPPLPSPLFNRQPNQTNSLADSDPATPAAIHAAHPTLAHALDTISEKGTTALAAASIGAKKGGGKIVTLLPVAPEQQGGIEGVVVEGTLVCASFLSFSGGVGLELMRVGADTVLGKSFGMFGVSFPASPEDKKAIEEWYVPSLHTSIPASLATNSRSSRPADDLLIISAGASTSPPSSRPASSAATLSGGRRADWRSSTTGST